MENKLKYAASADCFEEALPIGNGSLGAMVYGRCGDERISLNHDTLWCGKPRRLSKPGAYEWFVKARELALKGELREASNILADHLSDTYGRSYLPAGNLYIKRIGASEACEYYRELDFESGTVSQKYTEDGIRFEREYFISHPDNCIAVRFTSDRACSYEVWLDTPLKYTVEAENGQIILHGECPTELSPHYAEPHDIIEYGGDGIHYTVCTRAVCDGTVRCDGVKIIAENTSELILYTCIETSFIDFATAPIKDSLTPCIDGVSAVSAKKYEDIKAAHIADFSEYYNRVKLDLGFSESDKMTDVRMRAEDKSDDLGLVELLFNFGRYLLISSSRPGSQATNLQGIWNELIQPPWSCNYTVDINTEMNYWPVFACNLAEMNAPLVELIRIMSITGANTARELYNAKGYCAHSNLDLWGYTTMGGCNRRDCMCYAFWNVSAGWFCRHLWEQYEYTLDMDFLRDTAYPLMKGSAEFFLSMLIEDNGRFIICPSTSPENTYYYYDEEMGLAKYSTMSQAIAMDLFGNISRAASVLDIEDDFVREIREKLPKLNTYAIGSEGQLLEFDADWREADMHHRHISHLYGLYPGESITTESTPELAEACRRSLIRRGDFSTGWAMGWRVNFWAKLKDGDHALELIKNQLRFVEGENCKISYGADGGTYANMFDAHPPFQIDGNFGICMGIAQLLLQCEDGKIRILPALPRSFINGSVKGLKAKGNITVDISWKEGRLESYTLISSIDQSVTVATELGESVAELKAGEKYTFTPAAK